MLVKMGSNEKNSDKKMLAYVNVNQISENIVGVKIYVLICA